MSSRMPETFPEKGLDRALGLRIVAASADEVIVEWDVTPTHHQPFGIVHGGVHCAAVETACSVGASLSAREQEPDKVAVGLENHTSFIRAVRSGTLRARALPLTRGRTTQVWRAEVRDEEDRLVACGQVRLLCISHEHPLG